MCPHYRQTLITLLYQPFYIMKTALLPEKFLISFKSLVLKPRNSAEAYYNFFYFLVYLIVRFIFIFIFCLFFLPDCKKHEDVNRSASEVYEIEIEEEAVIIDPVQTRSFDITSSMDDRLLAAQVLICGIDGRGWLPPHITELLDECPAGGIMFFRYNLDTGNESIRSLLTMTKSFITERTGIPPFLAVDHEGGTVNRFSRGVATLPAASSYWQLCLAEGRQAALLKVEEDSLRAGREIRDLGFNLNFAPVAEYLNDNNRIFLDSRSYGPDVSFASAASMAFMRSMEQVGVLCVIKHFPGSAGIDPHYSASVMNGNKEALDRLIYPFSAAFRNGARAVMIAHTIVPSIDSKIASLSDAVMQNWLRGELGFGGIAISDDFAMAAAGGMKSEEAAVYALAAGVDMILVWPTDIANTHREIISALDDGRLTRTRLREAAQRIIYEKIRMNILINTDETP